MNRKWIIFGIIVGVCLLISRNTQAQTLAAQAPSMSAIDQIIIQFSEESKGGEMAVDVRNGRLQQLSEAVGYSLQYHRAMSGNAHVLRLPSQMSVAEVEAIADQLTQQSGVAFAQPDRMMQITGDPPPHNMLLATPNDPAFSAQWHYGYTAGTAEGLNLGPAWDITTGNGSMVVAVIDSGILNHVDLAGRTVPGYDFISNAFIGNDGNGRDNNPADPGDWINANECGYPHPSQSSSWHGTHVAGTIGAATNNGQGVAGVNWQAKILPVRALGKCGGQISDIVDGMRWAAGLPVPGVPANANPAKVLNLSLGGFGNCSTIEQNAINDINAAGSVVVVAAGNDNANASGYSPAGCNNVITVAATDRTGDKAYYSNFGSVVEVSAPGGETNVNGPDGVLSTLDGGTTTPNNDNAYAYYQGTSMAAPHVSGVVSLLMGIRPSMSPAQVSQHLQVTTRPFPAGSSCNTSICGTGIVDAFLVLSTDPPNLNQSIYLPIIMTPGAVAPNNPLKNPGFESGVVDWTEASTFGVALISHRNDLPASKPPRTGDWATWLGGSLSDDITYIEQQVTVPANAPHLAYWHWISSTESGCASDFAEVIINGGTIVDAYILCSTTNSNGWQKHTVDLSAYAGQSVLVQIRVEKSSASDVSNLYVDDVAFQANGG